MRHDVGQEDCVGFAVREVELSAERVGERVYASNAGVEEGDAGEEAAVAHVFDAAAFRGVYGNFDRGWWRHDSRCGHWSNSDDFWWWNLVCSASSSQCGFHGVFPCGGYERDRDDDLTGAGCRVGHY